MFLFSAESFLRGFTGAIGDKSRKRYQSSSGNALHLNCLKYK